MSNFLTAAKHSLGLWPAVFCFLLGSRAFAWPPTYGGELEFYYVNGVTSDVTSSSAATAPERQAQLDFVKRMEKRCLQSGCQVIREDGKWNDDYRVVYKDGWWFKISYDPGCVEITFKPSTLEELERQAVRINDQIYGTARRAGMQPKLDTSFHFNIGIRSAFHDDGKKFLRFFADYANHPDLALGGLGWDINNGPPLSVLDPDQRAALQKIIRAVEAGKMTGIAEIARAIQKSVYTKAYEDWGAPFHYQAIGLKAVNKTDLRERDAPMELRVMRAQESAEKFNLIARLMEKRIDFLNAQTSKIHYSSISRTDFAEEELRTRFELYVRDPGLEVSEFLDLLPEELRSVRPAAFLRSGTDSLAKFQSLLPYLDLLPNSPVLRHNLVSLMQDPTVRQSADAVELLYLLRQQKKGSSFFSRLLSRFQRPGDDLPLPASVAGDLLREIEVGGCRNVFH